MIVSNVEVYVIKSGDKEVPRVALTVEGYQFIFGLKADGRPDPIASAKCHGKIKQQAYAIAAVRLKDFQDEAAAAKKAPVQKCFRF